MERQNPYPMSVLVKSKAEMETFISQRDINSIETFMFISILDPDNDIDLLEAKDNHLTQRFYDLEYDIGANKAMSEEQAQELYDFIIKNKEKYSCIVHCSAGVSRSGAIGEFINDLFGLPYERFKRINPRISPNIHIKTLLNNLHNPKE